MELQTQPHPQTILITDDDRFSRVTLRLILEREGYRVLEADSGEACIRLFLEHSPNAILMDAIMPNGMDGFTCCTKIRQLPQGETVPILIITGLDDTLSSDRAFNSGATDYVPKPIRPPVLSSRLQHILNDPGLTLKP